MFVDSEIPMAKVLTDAQRDLEWEKWDLHARAQRKKSDKKETRQMMLLLLLSYVFVLFVAGFKVDGWFGGFLAVGVLTMAATWFYFWLEHTIALERELAQIKEHLHQIR